MKPKRHLIGMEGSCNDFGSLSFKLNEPTLPPWLLSCIPWRFRASPCAAPRLFNVGTGGEAPTGSRYDTSGWFDSVALWRWKLWPWPGVVVIVLTIIVVLVDAVVVVAVVAPLLSSSSKSMESNNEPLGEDTVEEVIPVEFLPVVLCPFPFCAVAFLKSPTGFHGLGAPITGACLLSEKQT